MWDLSTFVVTITILMQMCSWNATVRENVKALVVKLSEIFQVRPSVVRIVSDKKVCAFFMWYVTYFAITKDALKAFMVAAFVYLCMAVLGRTTRSRAHPIMRV